MSGTITPDDNSVPDYDAIVANRAAPVVADAAAGAPVDTDVPDYGAIVSARNAPPDAPGTKSGIAANAAAGVVEGSSGVLNTLADPIGNLIGKPLGAAFVAAHHYLAPKLGYSDLTPAQRSDFLGDNDQPQVGTRVADAVGDAIGATPLSDIKANTGLEQGVRAGTAGAIGFAALGGGNVVRQGAAGALAGEASNVVGNNVSDPAYRPLAETAAGLVTGTAADAGMAAAGSKLAGKSVQTQAADTLLQSASDPAAVKAAIAAGPADSIPNSPQTMAMLTNDSGIKNLEAVARTKDDGTFRDIDNARNSAQQAELSSVQPVDASATDTARSIVGNLNDLNVARDAAVAPATADAVVKEAAIPDAQTPADVGASARQVITDNAKPALDAVTSQGDAATVRANSAYNAVNPAIDGTSDATPSQQVGVVQHTLLSAAEAEAKPDHVAAYDRLRALVPDLSNDPAPIQAAMKQSLAEIQPLAGTKLPALEQDIYSTINGWSSLPVVPADAMLQFHQNLGEAIGQLKIAGQNSAVRRLTNVNAAVSGSIENALARKISDDNAAVSSHVMDIGDTFASRLDSPVGGSGYDPNTNQRPPPTVADNQPASPQNSHGAAGGSNSSVITESAQRAGGSFGGQSAPVAGVARPNDFATTPKEDLVTWIARNGGIKDPGGDIKAIGEGALTRRPGFYRPKTGMDPDMVREAAVEQGFLPDRGSRGNGVNQSDIGDLHDALSEHVAGRPTYRYQQQDTRAIQARAVKDQNTQAEFLDQARGHVDDWAEKTGFQISHDEADGIANELMRNPDLDVETAAERLAMRRANADLPEAPNAPSDFPGDQPSRPYAKPGSSRSDYESVGGDAATANSDAKTLFRRFAERFRNGAVGDALAETKYGDLKTQLSAMSSRFNKTPEGAQQYFDATGRTPMAEKAWSDGMALDAFSKPGMVTDGVVNPQKLAAWMKAKQEVLGVSPNTRARFDSLQKASQEVSDVQARRDEVTEGLNARLGKGTDSKFIEDAFPKGSKGTEAVQKYMRDTNGSSAAVKSLVDQVANTYRDVVFPGGEYKAGMPTYWSAQYKNALNALRQVAPDKAAIFDNAVSAREFVEKQTDTNNQTITDYQKSAAGMWLDPQGGAASPETAFSKIMQSPNPATTVKNLIGQMRSGGDESAVNGVRQLLKDNILGKAESNAEKGDDLGIKPDRFMNALKAPKNRAALEAAFNPEEMKVFDGVARDLQIGVRTTTGSAVAGSPSAKLLYGIGKSEATKPSSLMSKFLIEGVPAIAGGAIGYAVAGREGGLGGVVAGNKASSFLTKFAKDRSMKRNEAMRTLIDGALSDPTGKGRILMSHATPENTASLLDALSRRYMQSTMATDRRRR